MMSKINYSFLLILGFISSGMAQFSGGSTPNWFYSLDPVSIGSNTPYRYRSGQLPRLHIDWGFLRVGRGHDNSSRHTNMIKIGDGDYLRIGEWRRDDVMSFKASRGFNFTFENTSPYYNDIFYYIYATYTSIGLAVRSHHQYDWRYGFISAVNRDRSKAIAVINTSRPGDGEDVF